MGLASHLGPWLLGTVKNTIGTSAALGQVRNMGATLVNQTANVTYSDAAAAQACVIPAGAILTSCRLLVTTAFTGTGTPASSLQVFVNGNAVTSNTALTLSATGYQTLTLGSSNPALVANVGSVDAVITYTFTNTTMTAGAGILVFDYVVRNSDGTYAPSSYTA